MTCFSLDLSNVLSKIRDLVKKESESLIFTTKRFREIILLKRRERMKKIVILGSLVVLCISIQPQGAYAKSSSRREVKVEKGKTYTLKKFMKMISGTYKEYEAKTICKKMKKNTVKLSGKGITVKKDRFKVKTEGSYQLKIAIAKKKYKIRLKSVPHQFSLADKNVSYIRISAAVDEPQLKTVEIRNDQTVQQLIKKMNETGYLFDFKESSRVRVGFRKYYVDFYDAKDKKIIQLKVSNSSIANGEDNTHWLSSSEQAENVYQLVEKEFLEEISAGN